MAVKEAVLEDAVELDVAVSLRNLNVNLNVNLKSANPTAEKKK